jgi:hypothetical protein
MGVGRDMREEERGRSEGGGEEEEQRGSGTGGEGVRQGR